VLRRKDKQPQLFTTIAEWRDIARERNISFAAAAIEYEKNSSGWSEQTIWDYFEKIAGILDNQIHSLERIGYDKVPDTPLLPIYGKQWNRYLRDGSVLSDGLTQHILTHAFSTNAKIPGVKIVPGPMGTGGGYLYSALDAVREQYGYPHERVLEALAVAAALGALAYTHTNASGLVGCVGETGVCCAMTAGAITWLAGGDGVMVEHAASMALQANIGIPCDPIAGGLEFPCITRTLRAAVSAPMYADLALSGIDPLIPYHEMLREIERNYRVSDPKSLCSSQCGCCMTPTARRLEAALAGESTERLHWEPGR
jgi:L-serine dehydratase